MKAAGRGRSIICSLIPCSTAVPSPPRVLFVDDQAAIRLFVKFALDEMDIELVLCESVAEARQRLREAPAVLIITDLMMPGESGFDLLHELAQNPALRAGALQVVLSAALSMGDTPQRLREFDIWRALDKPISVTELEACVQQALAQRGPAPAALG